MLIFTTKNSYYSQKIMSCNGDTSEQWKIINTLVGENKNRVVDRIELEDGTGTIVSDPSDIAQEINRYLISVQSDRLSTVPALTLPPIRTHPHSLFLTPTTVDEVINTVKNMKNKKFSGFDGFSVLLIKSIVDEIAPVLVFLINNSFSKGVFPESFETKFSSSDFEKQKFL